MKNYKIEKGDKFECIKDYIMDDKSIAYSKGSIYLSENNQCITDNVHDIFHGMENEDCFFKHFKIVVKSEKPIHYQTDNNIDVIDFCKMYNLNFNLGNVVKYVARAGKKDDEMKDLEKALDFIQREIKYLKEK